MCFNLQDTQRVEESSEDESSEKEGSEAVEAEKVDEEKIQVQLGQLVQLKIILLFWYNWYT